MWDVHRKGARRIVEKLEPEDFSSKFRTLPVKAGGKRAPWKFPAGTPGDKNKPLGYLRELSAAVPLGFPAEGITAKAEHGGSWL
jgi:hypothetical protein